jgi:hypothetical protein
MIKSLSHIWENPFMTLVAICSLPHSTWSLCVVLSGQSPERSLTLAYVEWLIPGLALALTIDVGLIYFASRIIRGERAGGLFFNIAVLSLGTFTLQLFYATHHTPQLELSAGVGGLPREIAAALQVWAPVLFPAFIPIVTLTNAFTYKRPPQSHPEPARTSIEAPSTHALIAEVNVTEDDTAPVELPALPTAASTPAKQRRQAKPSQKESSRVSINCPDCAWMGSYSTERKAKNALTAHRKECNALQAPAKILVEQ